MISRVQWIYISLALTIITFAIITPTFFKHLVEGTLDEDILEIGAAWALSGINIIIRLFKTKGWNAKYTNGDDKS